jgi:hypothetical protein
MESGLIIGVFIILIIFGAYLIGGKTNAKINARLRSSNDKVIKQLISVLSNQEQLTIWNYINKLRDGDEISSTDYKLWIEFEKSIKGKFVSESESEYLMTFLGTELMIYGNYNYNPDKDVSTYLTIETSQKKVTEYNLNLFPQETCYLSGGINYFEERTISRHVSYGGITNKIGGFKTGSLTYTVTPNKGMSLIDYGAYFVTSKRIIFIGNKDRTIRQINLSAIISFEIFKDSILLHIANNKKPMFLQMEYDFTKRNMQGDFHYSFRYDHILIGLLLRKLMGKIDLASKMKSFLSETQSSSESSAQITTTNRVPDSVVVTNIPPDLPSPLPSATILTPTPASGIITPPSSFNHKNISEEKKIMIGSLLNSVIVSLTKTTLEQVIQDPVSSTSTPPLLNHKHISEEKKIMIGSLVNSVNGSLTTASLEKVVEDKSIIDVTSPNNQVERHTGLTKYIEAIPYWKHQYVYSYAEINSASEEQKRFYQIFKNSFHQGIYYDLEGNTNYAFILLFDLLNEYENHKEISILERQLQALGQGYPKTKSYGISFLVNRIELKGDEEGALEHKLVGRQEYQNADYNYWGLGNKYKDKLKLNATEVKLLNTLIDTDNKFNSIEFCALKLISLLFKSIEFLEEHYQKSNTKFEIIINEIAHEEITGKYRYREGSYNYKSIFENFNSTVYQCMYKTCENSLREYFKVGRKTELTWYLHSKRAIVLLNENVINIIQPFINLRLSEIKEVELESEIKINNYSRSRYKNELKYLSEIFDAARLPEYNKAIENLELRNQGNPFIENIYFEASKFVSKFDKLLSLNYYIKYLYHDLKSESFDNKQLTKTIQKNLFKTNEQLHDFEIVVSELLKDKDLDKALKRISSFYSVKRKKIQLDTLSIKEVQHQHKGTVELLNVYLKDEYEDDVNTIKTQEINNEEVTLEITKKVQDVQHSIYRSNISLTQVQQSTLELFSKSNFSVSQIELETFAKSQGVFKNQLIESINEVCFENLDDILIEEEEDYFTINANYYQNLLAV